DPRGFVLEWVSEPPDCLVFDPSSGGDPEAHLVLLLHTGGGLACDGAAVVARNLLRSAGRIGHMACERGTDVDVVNNAVLCGYGCAGVEAARMLLLRASGISQLGFLGDPLLAVALHEIRHDTLELLRGVRPLPVCDVNLLAGGEWDRMEQFPALD